MDSQARCTLVSAAPKTTSKNGSCLRVLPFPEVRTLLPQGAWSRQAQELDGQRLRVMGILSLLARDINPNTIRAWLPINSALWQSFYGRGLSSAQYA